MDRKRIYEHEEERRGKWGERRREKRDHPPEVPPCPLTKVARDRKESSNSLTLAV